MTIKKTLPAEVEISLSLEVFKVVVLALKRLPENHRQRVIQAAMIFLRDNDKTSG